jgi:hypothetical protein
MFVNISWHMCYFHAQSIHNLSAGLGAMPRVLNWTPPMISFNVWDPPCTRQTGAIQTLTHPILRGESPWPLFRRTSST